ncbi:zinc finger and BTB domain-containing protein 2a isoform X2 [Danio aesculapii]|uniref:zinc finger and BTB domain-containing protein 2a isoform X2 n=1 Tax=Danio aesculapii TaxID=1142201 RepID=UPI0024BFEBA2|nr:zinc finger and BTB domain-containing protein 2a isoform X2 [Danio aesculapii]
MDLAHHGLVLLKRLNAQREFGFLCDCTVAIGDVLFKAHKAVLAAFSNYFRMLFIHQESDCVRLKPSDIQADIFSYLLNLMYTGKFTAQPIDPIRLEQGIPDQTCSRPERNSTSKDDVYAKSSDVFGREFLENTDMDYRSPQPVGIDSPTQNPAATMVQHLTYGIMSRSASSRKHYTCNYCGVRFNQRCKLKEHLLVHTNQATEPQVSAPQNGHNIDLECQDIEEDHLHADSDVISDTDQQAWMEDTPPPSEIADIDNLDGTEMGREMKRRKFECPTCARKFIQKSHWREHMYIHTGKPYKCSACAKNFCRANQAARHVCLSQDADSYIMVNKQSLVLCGGEDNSQVEALFQTSERPYKCSMCATPFASPSEVPKHQCLTENEAAASAEYSMAENENQDLAAPPEVTTPS